MSDIRTDRLCKLKCQPFLPSGLYLKLTGLRQKLTGQTKERPTIASQKMSALVAKSALEVNSKSFPWSVAAHRRSKRSCLEDANKRLHFRVSKIFEVKSPIVTKIYVRLFSGLFGILSRFFTLTLSRYGCHFRLIRPKILKGCLQQVKTITGGLEFPGQEFPGHRWNSPDKLLPA